MTVEPTLPPPTPVARRWGEGDRRWFLGAWATIAVAAGQADGRADVVTQELPAGYSPPAHRHAARDEVVVVVRGEVELRCGGDRWLLGPGGVALIPRGAVHGLTVGLGGPADVVVVGVPAGLGALVEDLGTPADLVPDLPPAPDVAALRAAADRHDLVVEQEG